MAFALTFDDGPGPSTPELLHVLDKHNCRATFFLLGENLRDPLLSPAAVDAIRHGHLAGNHTMTHNGKLGFRELRAEIEECDRLVDKCYREAIATCPRPIPFRLPFGIRTFIAERMEAGARKPAAALDNRLQVLASMGRTHVHWTALFPDWEMRASSDIEQLVSAVVDHIVKMQQEGLDAVITLHDGSQRDEKGKVATREHTITAVDRILTMAKLKGWTTFRVPAV